MDCQDRLVREELFLDPGYFKVMPDVAGHVLELEPFHVAPSYDPGGKGPRRMEHEIVYEVVLPGKDHGHEGPGVHLELAQGMELGENLDPQKRGLVYDEDRDLLSLGGLYDGGPKYLGELCQGIAVALGVESGAKEPHYIDYGAGGADERYNLVS